MKRVVNFSGGIPSWLAARRVAERHGTADMVLLFANTRIEDEDTYRFLVEASADVGAPLTPIQDGRTPWQVFHDERFIGNSRVDPCSKILKRELLNRWHIEHCDPAETVIYIGLTWMEYHRVERFQERMRSWTVEAPLCEPPYLIPQDMMKLAEDRGIKPPRLYQLGFPHNNCGGFCVKAGQAHFALLLKHFPERYLEHESKEEAERAYLGKDVAIMSEVRDGVKRPLTMRALRERIQAGGKIDEFDFGGCGCAI